MFLRSSTLHSKVEGRGNTQFPGLKPIKIKKAFKRLPIREILKLPSAYANGIGRDRPKGGLGNKFRIWVPFREKRPKAATR